MAVRTLVTSLAAFGATVAGIAHSYDLDVEPPKISREKLPCLLIGNVLLGGSDWKTTTFMGNAPQQVVQVDHLLLVETWSAQMARDRVLPTLLTLHDAYVAAAAASKYLNYESIPLRQVVISFGTDYGDIETGDGKFYGVIYTHKYALNM